MRGAVFPSVSSHLEHSWAHTHTALCIANAQVEVMAYVIVISKHPTKFGFSSSQQCNQRARAIIATPREIKIPLNSTPGCDQFFFGLREALISAASHSSPSSTPTLSLVVVGGGCVLNSRGRVGGGREELTLRQSFGCDTCML